MAARTNLPSAYAALAADRTHPFLVELPDSHDASREAASQPTTVVVTRSALITGERIGVLWLLQELHPRLVVPRSLIDEMHEERVELVDGTHRGYFGLAHVDGDLITQEAPAAHFRNALARFDETYAWMMRSCQVLPRPLSNVGADDEGIRDLIGASSYDSVVLAGDLGGVIFADDWGLRRISHSRTASLGFSTYGLLLAAREAGLITHEQFELHTAELVQLGQAGFPMTAGSFRGLCA